MVLPEQKDKMIPEKPVEKPAVPAIIEKKEQLEAIERPVPQKEEHLVKDELEKAKLEMARPSTPAPGKSKVRVEIEDVLAKDLTQVYSQMSAGQKKIFKQKGEETSAEIETLIKKAKLKIKKILGLIRSWLLLIPGVNKFFLEQEAKIKTDEILRLRDDLIKRGQL